ncbi:MAG: Ycf51 family protein [Cyanobacteria bacterium P01_F01_bin.33]
MIDTALFAQAARIGAVLVSILLLLTVWAWIRQTSWRFAFVGYTAFTIVLSAGLWALSLGPIVRTTIPGAGRYTVVYDRGSDRATIAVATDITPEKLEPTLLQAASNLYSSGRYSSDTDTLTICARTVLHPEEGITEALELGRVQRSLARRSDPDLQVDIDNDAFARLQQYLSDRG